MKALPAAGQAPVLVLDADSRSALAAVRSLGGHELEVHTADSSAESLAGRSRYSATYHRLPPPTTAPVAYATAVRALAGSLGAEVVFPMTDVSVLLTQDAGGPVSNPRIAAASREAYLALSDKAALIRRARELGLRVPLSMQARSAAELRMAVCELGYPSVLKPARSLVQIGDRIIGTSVVVANRADDVDRFADNPWLGETVCLAQRFIPGRGAGVFTLFGTEGAVAWFAHRRIREKPPRGGVSVLSESAPVDPALKALSTRLLDDAGWFGPAMVEFRIDAEGQAWLMEVNGRFWGSLQLAIDSGVDFPWLLHQLCRDQPVTGTDVYKVGQRLRWLLGDLDHLLLQLRGKGTAQTAFEKLRAVRQFLRPHGPATRLEVLRPGDRGPFRHEVRRWLASLGS
jgi:predicted ATP-grasp superfamily ATP-dependent carboligase